MYMASAARKRARTGGGGEADEEPVPVADGFEAPIFGARIVGQASTLALEGEDGPLSRSGWRHERSRGRLVRRDEGLAAARLGGRARAPRGSRAGK